MDLKDAVCVVTGASEGIGFSIADALATRGAAVAICARTARKVSDAVERLRAGSRRAVGVPADVSSEPDVARLRDFVHTELGPIDVLVNNAGLAHFAPVEDLTTRQFDEIMAVNVRGIFLTTRAFLPDLRKKQRGEIVNVASLAGRNGFIGGAAYTASKHAVLGFSKSLMLEVRKDNIRVITICPGSVRTPFFEKSHRELPNAGSILTPEDVATTVIAALELPGRAMISELDIRPTNP